uniref:Asp-tRNA(Asn)/Glu-tRNA(Gln) amidotransferase subunit GatA n=1 Tax=uncultured Spongiibacter sp. TaxID=870896 RepID=UPI002598C364
MPSHTVADLLRGLAAGDFSSEEITRQYLNDIEQRDGHYNSFISVTAEQALNQARAADAARANGEAGSLNGLPIAHKDIFCTEGVRTSCASKMLDNFIAPYSATVVKKMAAAGAVMLGKTNLDEFAMGSSNETSFYGAVRNPWNRDKVPGGSSGGSAAAVAAGLAPAATGTDTGGSIRQPAALCGCVGLKPTYGRVSRYGVVAFASSLDQVGPLTKDVHDSATLLGAMSGHDPHDSTSVPTDVPDYAAGLGGDLKGIKLGLPKEYLIDGIDPEVRAAFDAAVKQCEALGAEIHEVSMPHTEYGVATYYIVATAEASANLARYDGIRYGDRVDGDDPFLLYCNTRGQGFGEEVKRRIILGTYVLSSGYYDAYYLRAQKARTLIKRDFEQAFETVDALITPTVPAPAFKAGEKMDDPLQMYLSDIFTISCNLAGTCGISLPCGFTSEPKLPIGLQFLG